MRAAIRRRSGWAGVALLAALVVTGLTVAPATVAADHHEQDIEASKAIVRAALEALSRFDYDALDQYFTQDYRRYSQATPGVKIDSLDDFKELARGWQTTFSNVEQSTSMMIAEGDIVAVYGNFSGDQTGPMAGFPPTGKRVSSDFAGYHRIRDGKIAETWVTWDNLITLHQLGLFPPRPPARTDEKQGGSQ